MLTALVAHGKPAVGVAVEFDYSYQQSTAHSPGCFVRSAKPSRPCFFFTSYCEILDDMQFCLTSTVVNISQMLVHP